MSFGFSISDFALCAQICHGIYRALKEAPRECEAFAEEVLHLHSLLQALSHDIEHISEQPDGVAALAGRRPMLSEHGSRCIELLVADIAVHKNLLKASGWRVLSWTDLMVAEPFAFRFEASAFYFEASAFYFEASALRQRFSQAKFVRQIPHLREAVANIVSKLTFKNVILIRYRAYQRHRRCN
jgi:hypothetical protein